VRAIALLLFLGLPAVAAAAHPGDPGGATLSTPPPGTPPPPPPPPTGTSIGAKAVAIAMRYLGIKYTWAGASPKTGFDCSGFTMYVYAKLGIHLSHYSGDQWNEGYRIDRAHLRPGDLVFFHQSKDGPQHEGMYVANDKFIQAPHTGDVVKISSLKELGYASSYVGAVRPYGLGQPIVFPVVAPSTYTNDFGISTSRGTHLGTNISAPRKAIVVAAEGGTVKITTKPASAGCSLSLNGKSGTTYVYKHLNNDATNANDNTGACVEGIAYAPGLVTGQKVSAGQMIGFVGDSGDANGTHPHLDFEVHPHRGDAVNPYPFLNKSQRLLFAVLPGSNFTLQLNGKVASKTAATLTVQVTSLRAWPGGYHFSVGRTVTVNVSESSQIFLSTPGLAANQPTTLLSVQKGQAAVVKTVPAKTTLQAQLGKSGWLDALQIVLDSA
jgi:hypothetical protein